MSVCLCVCMSVCRCGGGNGGGEKELSGGNIHAKLRPFPWLEDEQIFVAEQLHPLTYPTQGESE